jgi:hypothetical protein
MRDIEKFLIFPTVTDTHCYGKRSKSYEFLDINHVATSQCSQAGATWKNSNFDHGGILIPKNY